MNRRLSLFVLTIGCLFSASLLAQDKPALPDAGRGLIAYWDKPWGIAVDLQGLHLQANTYDEQGRRYLLASDDSGLLMFSAMLEEVEPGRSGESCKNSYNDRARSPSADNLVTQYITGAQKKNVKIWENGDRTYMEYNIPSIELPDQKPIAVNQENRFMCFRHDDVFVDLHVSKSKFQPGAEQRFDSILESVQILEGITRTSADYWVAGSALFAQRQYKKAVPAYAKALSMEQNTRQLDKKLWYVLVDNLGMAYGITGDLENARKTFEYGLQNDPDYPMFYYEMADYYGEKGDQQNAMDYLKKAYDRRANMIPGEHFPDPLADDSFKKLLKNREFRAFVESLPVELQHRPR